MAVLTSHAGRTREIVLPTALQYSRPFIACNAANLKKSNPDHKYTQRSDFAAQLTFLNPDVLARERPVGLPEKAQLNTSWRRAVTSFTSPKVCNPEDSTRVQRLAAVSTKSTWLPQAHVRRACRAHSNLGLRGAKEVFDSPHTANHDEWSGLPGTPSALAEVLVTSASRPIRGSHALAGSNTHRAVMPVMTRAHGDGLFAADRASKRDVSASIALGG